MKVAVLYRPNSEHARKMEEFAHDFERRVYGRKVELVSLDTRDGAATASLYDIVRNPAILVLDDQGRVSNFWEGDNLPLIDEVASYVS